MKIVCASSFGNWATDVACFASGCDEDRGGGGGYRAFDRQEIDARRSESVQPLRLRSCRSRSATSRCGGYRVFVNAKRTRTRHKPTQVGKGLSVIAYGDVVRSGKYLRAHVKPLFFYGFFCISSSTTSCCVSGYIE